MNYGFIKVGAAVPKLKVADCEYNARQIIEMVKKAEAKGIQIVVFPELSLTGYTCGDLFQQQVLLKEARFQLEKIIQETKRSGIVSIIGMPVYADSQLFNCAVVIQGGKVLGVVPKTYIPGYSEFYEERWFAPANKALSNSLVLFGQEVPFGADLLFSADHQEGVCFGVEICEDLWVPIPPSSYQALAGATLLLNLSASNEIVGKYEYRRALVQQQSAKCVAGYAYASAGTGESTTDVVFGGHAMIGEYGAILEESSRFSREAQLVYADVDTEKIMADRMKNTSYMEHEPQKVYRKIWFECQQNGSYPLKREVVRHPFVPANPAARDKRCREIFDIQTTGLAKRLQHTGISKAVIGISGGLDSTLALLVTAKTFEMLGLPSENLISVTMPGFGTTDETYHNAIKLMRSMKVNIREIDIKPSCIQHFKDIGHDISVHDVTYENVQARERTQILMDIANKVGGLVIGTGDLSELALGWCTYNGDHMSMYAVNTSIPKTLVKFLVQWVADHVVEEETKQVLHRILDTPISPELLPPGAQGEINQKTEDIVGPYELHDFFMYHMVRYGASPQKIRFLAQKAFEGRYTDEVIKGWLKVFYRRFFSQQFKRSCLPDGPKVGTISLSPRGDWRMPSDAVADIWMKALE